MKKKLTLDDVMRVKTPYPADGCRGCVFRKSGECFVPSPPCGLVNEIYVRKPKTKKPKQDGQKPNPHFPIDVVLAKEKESKLQETVAHLEKICSEHEQTIRELRQQISDTQGVIKRQAQENKELREQKDNAVVELSTIRARHSIETCSLERTIRKLRSVFRTMAEELIRTHDPEEGD